MSTTGDIIGRFQRELFVAIPTLKSAAEGERAKEELSPSELPLAMLYSDSEEVRTGEAIFNEDRRQFAILCEIVYGENDPEHLRFDYDKLLDTIDSNRGLQQREPDNSILPSSLPLVDRAWVGGRNPIVPVKDTMVSMVVLLNAEYVHEPPVPT